MSKYKSKKVISEYGTFDSKKEYKRYLELNLLESAGVITNLKRQVRFQLLPSQKCNGKVIERPVYYIADFVYSQGEETIVEDTKGFKTPDYILKRKLMLYLLGIRVKEL